jgi:hypothetical protein
MLSKIISIVNGLRAYAAPVVQNFRPPENETLVVPAEAYANSDLWHGICIHHSSTVDGLTNDWDGIRRYHMSYRIDGVIVDEATFKNRQLLGHGKKFEKPWRDVGYHGCWENVNGVYQFKMGRPWNMAGAHAGVGKDNTYNETHLGLCVVGNWDTIEPPKGLWDLCLKSTREIMARLKIDKVNVIGHYEVYDKLGLPRKKSCPGKMFSMDRYRSAL